MPEGDGVHCCDKGTEGTCVVEGRWAELLVVTTGDPEGATAEWARELLALEGCAIK